MFRVWARNSVKNRYCFYTWRNFNSVWLRGLLQDDSSSAIYLQRKSLWVRGTYPKFCLQFTTQIYRTLDSTIETMCHNLSIFVYLFIWFILSKKKQWILFFDFEFVLTANYRIFLFQKSFLKNYKIFWITSIFFHHLRICWDQINWRILVAWIWGWLQPFDWAQSLFNLTFN